MNDVVAILVCAVVAMVVVTVILGYLCVKDQRFLFYHLVAAALCVFASVCFVFMAQGLAKNAFILGYETGVEETKKAIHNQLRQEYQDTNPDFFNDRQPESVLRQDLFDHDGQML